MARKKIEELTKDDYDDLKKRLSGITSAEEFYAYRYLILDILKSKDEKYYNELKNVDSVYLFFVEHKKKILEVI